MRRVTIVGQAPGRHGNRRPFDGASGRRLARLAGLGSYEQLAARCRLQNVLGRWPGKQGRGDAFPLALARSGARASRFRGRGPVLLAGRRVAAAFGVRTGYFEWGELRGRPCAVIPHPSGISHWWNDPRNARRAAAFLREVLA